MKVMLVSLLLLLGISFLTGCTPIVQHADPFYNYNESEFPRDYLPIIEPLKAIRERPSEPWGLELLHFIWHTDSKGRQLHYFYGSVQELEKFAVKDGAILAYSSYVDKEANANIQDSYYYWFVIVPSKNITEGFHTEDAFRAYIQTLGIHDADWQTPDDAFNQFMRTGCLAWFPDCK